MRGCCRVIGNRLGAQPIDYRRSSSSPNSPPAADERPRGWFLDRFCLGSTRLRDGHAGRSRLPHQGNLRCGGGSRRRIILHSALCILPWTRAARARAGTMGWVYSSRNAWRPTAAGGRFLPSGFSFQPFSISAFCFLPVQQRALGLLLAGAVNQCEVVTYMPNQRPLSSTHLNGPPSPQLQKKKV